jgi:hypothetical protein
MLPNWLKTEDPRILDKLLEAFPNIIFPFNECLTLDEVDWVEWTSVLRRRMKPDLLKVFAAVASSLGFGEVAELLR